MPRRGAGPALAAGAGSAQGCPQAGTCCAPVPKKATSAGSGSGSSPMGQCLPGADPTAPAMHCCQHPHTWAATPPQGHPSTQSHEEPTTSLPQGRAWGHCPLHPACPKEGQGGPLSPSSTFQPQTNHKDWLGSSSCTRYQPGAESPWNTLCHRASLGLLRAQVLIWDWSVDGLSPGIRQHMDSQVGLIMHKLSHSIGQSMDSDKGLVIAVILTQDWSEQHFSHRIGQSRDSKTGLLSEWILTWDWSTNGF